MNNKLTWRWFMVMCGVLAMSSFYSFASAAPVHGKWIYASAVMSEADGKKYDSAVYGSLSLNADGTWKMERRIGGILGTGEGRYSIKGNGIALKTKDGKIEFEGTYFIEKAKDSDGKVFETLTLDKKYDDGSRMLYLLTKK